VSANTGGANDVPFTVTLNGSAVVAPKNTASSNVGPAAAGGGGCTVLRGDGAQPDATLAALALFALLWRRGRRRRAHA
jgi:hypothetical protein